MRFFLADLEARLRERKIWVAVAMFAYALAAMPALLSNPPAHLREALEGWFGSSDPFTLFMYLWVDTAMNKLVVILAVAFAGGLLVSERDRRTLAVLWSKPISRTRYFLVRTASAAAALALLYAGLHLVGLAWFSFTIPGFRPGLFILLASVHVFAGVVSVCLAATIAAWVGRSALALGLSLLIELSLVGAALVGFYNPAWREAAWLNPYALAVEPLGHLSNLSVMHIALPMLSLAAWSAAIAAVGALGARRWAL